MHYFTFEDMLILIMGGAVAAFLFFSKDLKSSSVWDATITPLASIMGSGFLVCAPLLYAAVGYYAVFAMAGLLAVSYAIGGVIRFNIKHLEPLLNGSPPGEKDGKRENHRMHNSFWSSTFHRQEFRTMRMAERISHLVLVAAYCISISYYLQLLAHFGFHYFSWHDEIYNRMLVTAILLTIGTVGVFRGLKGIEKVERYTVNLNLALIAALLVGLIYFNISAWMTGSWALPQLDMSDDTTHTIRILMGLLIVVQGFETSRFLGSEHSKGERIKTMRDAQFLAAGIYITFVGLMAAVIGRAGSSTLSTDVTAIVNLSALIAPILPIMISLTAIGSQFSAATADDAGCAGLLQSFIKGSRKFRYEYAIVSGLAIALTWVTNIYEIINYASRAFALFYMIQCIVALMVWFVDRKAEYSKLYLPYFGALGLLCLAVTIFGIPAG